MNTYLFSRVPGRRNIIVEPVKTASAVNVNRARAAAGTVDQVFDWNKAARLIVAKHPKGEVSAGLNEDWGHTAGVIFCDGQPVRDDYTYLASMWATPCIELDGVRYPCGTYKARGWTAQTKWPASALAIVKKLKKSV